MKDQCLWLAIAVCLAALTAAGCTHKPVPSPPPFDMHYTQWNRLLARYVSGEGVDYQGFAGEKEALGEVLKAMQSVNRQAFESWSPRAKLAFVVNAHNAFAIDRIIRHWPVESMDQTRRLGDPREAEDIKLLGKHWSLEDLAEQIVSDDYMEARAIFLINWCERGCAPLAPVAATEFNLDDLSESQTRLAMSQSRFCEYNTDRPLVRVTPLIKWYRPAIERDFTTRWVFLERYLPAEQAKAAQRRPPAIRYLAFDRSLNSAAAMHADGPSEPSTADSQ